MKKYNLGKSLAAIALAWAIIMLPLVATVSAQTKIKMPKNKYKIQDDVKIGREGSAEAEKVFPIISDAQMSQYIENVGRKLVNAIPSEFQQPAFQYRFKIINARDINAFALPGGPMYINRGMIEAAKNEGEMAGVMAHEISHVALRHGTAQATQQSNPITQILGIGAILGGAILGGEQGAALGQQVYAGLFVYPNSREAETNADILGSQILASAGYDPSDLANMFKTIEKESGGSGPEWLSTHPNPQNRYENINRERGLLRVSNNPIKMTAGFERTQAKLRNMPRAQTMEEIQKSKQGQTSTSGGKYESNVPNPSTRTRVFQGGQWIRMNVPDNWEEFPAESEVWFSPKGAYGDQGITHGAIIGVQRPQSRNLQTATQQYVDSVLQANNYLDATTNYQRTTIAGRQGYVIQLAGTSPVTRRTEVVTVYTTSLRNGDMLYFETVVPQNEAARYDTAFRNIIRSLVLSD
ncbi:MAG TPA: M48 family metalloprotease [Pyrinomonadaceae bacterium]|nr:M48 family metalloprotease [Pyrinomonadaceae bacterium]